MNIIVVVSLENAFDAL